ncbi:hypothetical protein AURDEDRAFT_163632 [Auricularia subglabra TFB-10046 SS5]|nr:hypothetical protein AURDEDRAFT_163632 [Auricularia subglabra TFB-10046 SS5]
MPSLSSLSLPDNIAFSWDDIILSYPTVALPPAHPMPHSLLVAPIDTSGLFPTTIRDHDPSDSLPSSLPNAWGGDYGGTDFEHFWQLAAGAGDVPPSSSALDPGM